MARPRLALFLDGLHVMMGVPGSGEYDMTTIGRSGSPHAPPWLVFDRHGKAISCEIAKELVSELRAHLCGSHKEFDAIIAGHKSGSRVR